MSNMYITWKFKVQDSVSVASVTSVACRIPSFFLSEVYPVRAGVNNHQQ